MNSTYKVIFLLFFTVLGVSGCLNPVHVPPENQFNLTAVSAVSYKKSSHKIMLVTVPTAAPAFQTQAMQYSLQPYQIKSYSYNEWVASPDEMLLPLLVESITNSNLYKAVISPPYSGLSDYRLDTRIVDFRQIIYAHRSQFSFKLQAILVKQATHRVIWSKNFSSNVEAAATPQSGVAAANRAVQLVLTQLVQALNRSS